MNRTPREGVAGRRQLFAEAHSLVLLPSVRSSFWSHRQELYPHTTACFCCASCASVGMIVHFISPQDKGMGRHLDISPTASRDPSVCWLSASKLTRSEERRVGKEGRSRWSPYH